MKNTTINLWGGNGMGTGGISVINLVALVNGGSVSIAVMVVALSVIPL